MRAALLAAAAVLLTSSLAEAGRPVARFALVVGNNAALPGSGYAALSYADDDAARFADLMRRLGATVELLVAPDEETSARFGPTLEGARTPTRRSLAAALDHLEAALASREDAEREVYVYFSGHGSVTSSSSYLHLLDGPFHRTDLYAQILDRLPRERMHVIIDSCHAYFLANARGRTPAREDTAESVARHPDVGFLLSTSDRREVHEWGGFRAGVFSYQLLGAMQGAADVDADGQVSYAEAQAYIVAANLGVQNPRARVRPFIRRPAGQSPRLLDLRALPKTERVRIPGPLVGRLRMLDGHGFPVLDANKPEGQLLVLARPTGDLPILELDGQRYRTSTTSEGGLTFSLRPQADEITVSARGAVADEFREHLFRQPLSQDFVLGLEAAIATADVTKPLERAPAWHEDPLTVGLLSGSGAALVVGGVFTGLFVDRVRVANQDPVTDATAPARRRAEAYRAVMSIGFATGVTLGVAAALNAWFGRTTDVSDLTWTVGATESSLDIGLGGRF